MIQPSLQFTTCDCIGNNDAEYGMFGMVWGSPVSQSNRHASRLAETKLIPEPRGRKRVTDRIFDHA